VSTRNADCGTPATLLGPVAPSLEIILQSFGGSFASLYLPARRSRSGSNLPRVRRSIVDVEADLRPPAIWRETGTEAVRFRHRSRADAALLPCWPPGDGLVIWAASCPICIQTRTST